MNYPEGSAGAFIGILITILGSVALGGSALLVLQQSEDDPAAEATSSAVVTTVTPEAGTGTATPVVATSTITSTATPTPTPTSTPSPTPTEPPVEEIEYVVVAGDALNLIASRHGVPSAAIIERNGLVSPYTLEVGQVLIIPME